MGAIKKIYDSTGRPLRIAGINAYGVRNRLRLREWERILREIEYTERLDREAQIRLVRGKLEDIVSFAIRNVPFYGQFSSLLDDIGRADIFEVLAKLPPIGKDEINKEPRSFLSSVPGKHFISRTSGTSGTPLDIHMDREAYVLGDALWWRRAQWAGYEKGDWIARLVGDPIIPLRVKNPKKPWIISYPDRRIYFSTYHLNKDTSVKIGELLNDRQPAFLMGYPSSLEILSTFLEETGFELRWKPKYILFSSEPMYPHMESVITRVFRSKLRGLYGSAEKVISAAQCEKGTYHLSLVDGFVEGQFGIMESKKPALVTTLANRVMPLIRYRIGDVIEAQPSLECECGRTLPAMSPVITRAYDWVITPSGRRLACGVVTLAFLHHDTRGIRQSQIVQDGPGSLKVYLVADEENFRKFAPKVKESLHEVCFGEMDIEVIRTDHVDLMSSGKSKFIVNQLRRKFEDAAADAESQNG